VRNISQDSAPSPKTVVASADTPPAPSVQAAPAAPAEVDADTIPRPELKSLSSAGSAPQKDQAAAAPTPDSAVMAASPDTPKLPEAEVAAAAPPPAAPKSVVKDIEGGFSDLLSDSPDTSRKATSAPGSASSASELATPPADLTAKAPASAATEHAQAGQDSATPPSLVKIPSDSAVPPLASKVDASDPDTNKILMAANDVPQLATRAPSEAEAGKPELPSPPLGVSTEEMAQATLTPVSAQPPGSAAPAAPPAAPSAPAIAAPAAPAAAEAVSTSSPSVIAHPTIAGAATPDGVAPGTSPDLAIIFNESETDIPLASTAQLDGVAKTLLANPTQRVILVAYASGPETTGIYPKRVSLARGIAVRNYLTTTRNVDIERVDVKAQGNKNEGNGPGDRVDLFIVK
jgi:outer membrane protein OmpA-like peptidoglycan-associated protein